MDDLLARTPRTDTFIFSHVFKKFDCGLRKSIQFKQQGSVLHLVGNKCYHFLM